jgi:hypothetical protein
VVAQKVKILIALLATIVLLIGAGVAFAANSGASDTSAGAGGQVVGQDDDSDGPGDDADEPGDFDGAGDTED